MIHASNGLLDAMRGEWNAGDDRASNACGSGMIGGFVGRTLGTSAVLGRIDCPACARLVRAATDCVRWDHLETLGLAPKLEAK